MLPQAEHLKGITAIVQAALGRHLPPTRISIITHYRPFPGPRGTRIYRVLSERGMVPTQVELEVRLEDGDNELQETVRQATAFEAELNEQLPLNVLAYTTCRWNGQFLTPIARLGRARLGKTLLIGGRMAVDDTPLATVEEIIKLIQAHKDDEKALRHELNALLMREFKEDDVLGPETMNLILTELRSLTALVGRHDAAIAEIRGSVSRPHKHRPGS